MSELGLGRERECVSMSVSVFSCAFSYSVCLFVCLFSLMFFRNEKRLAYFWFRDKLYEKNKQ